MNAIQLYCHCQDNNEIRSEHHSVIHSHKVLSTHKEYKQIMTTTHVVLSCNSYSSATVQRVQIKHYLHSINISKPPKYCQYFEYSFFYSRATSLQQVTFLIISFISPVPHWRGAQTCKSVCFTCEKCLDLSCFVYKI